MSIEMTVPQFTALVQFEHDRLEALFEQVPPEQMEQTGAVGEWSIRDLIAHITWYEKEMLTLLRERSLANASSLWELSDDPRNQAIFDANRGRALRDILTEAKQVYADLLPEIEKLTEADLFQTSQYKGMPSDWIPWQILAENTYLHYRQHSENMRLWIEQHSSL